MNINTGVQQIMESFRKTGTLGAQAQHHDMEGIELELALAMRAGDSAEIASYDNGEGDQDPRSGFISLNAAAASSKVPSGFGSVTSYEAEYRGDAADPESVTLSVNGPESHKFTHFAASGDELLTFEVNSKNGKALVAAGKFTRDAEKGEIRGYMEALNTEIPWYVGK